MLEHIVFYSGWIIGIIFVFLAVVCIVGGLYSLSVDQDGSAFLLTIFATIGLGLIGYCSISVGQAAQDEIQEAKAHPCIQWGNDYDHGKLGQVCIKRKP